MTPDELWEKYADDIVMGEKNVPYNAFLAALHEYGASVRARDVEIVAEGLTENQLAVACSHAGLDYSVFLKIKAYLPVAPTPAALNKEK